MRRRRLVSLTLALVSVLGTAWVVRVVLTPPRRLRTLSHGTGIPGVRWSWLTGVRFSPDGRYLLTSGLEVRRGGADTPSALVWDVRDWHLVRQIPHVRALGGFTGDGRLLLTADEGGRIRLRDAHTGVPTEKLSRPVDLHHPSLAISPDGRWIATIPKMSTGVRIWNRARETTVTQDGFSSGIAGFSPDSQLLATEISGWGGSAIRVLEAKTGRNVRLLTAYPFAFMPGGQIAAGCEQHGTVTFWNTKSWKVVRRLPAGGSITSLAFSADGRMLATSSHTVVQVLDAISGRALLSLRVPHSPQDLAFSPDGSLLVMRTGREVQVWQIPPRGQLILRAILLDLLR